MNTQENLDRIGNNIRKFREKKKMQQQDLAAMCNFEKSAMHRIEKGGTNVTIRTLTKIANALEIEIFELLK